MSIDELATGIGGSRETVQRAATEVMAMKTKAEELSTAFSGMSAESMSAYMTEVAGQLDTAHQTLTGVADGLEQTQSTAAGARQHGGGLLGGDNPGPAPPPTRPTFKPMRTDPGKVADVQPYVGEPIAYATLWDADGRQVVGVHSADDDGPAKTAKWNAPWGGYPRLRRHVEAHAAARMHRDGHKEMAMYINLPPCSYPDGCRYNVADLIPEGSRLWVHWTTPTGGVRIKRFEGTGKAIDD